MRMIQTEPLSATVLMDATTTVAVPSAPRALGDKIRYLDNLGTAATANITITGALSGTITFNTAYAHTLVEWVGNGWMTG